MKARLYWVGLIAAWLGLADTAQAEKIRTIYANDRMVQPIHLSMGRSTVLRFDEKPKTVVVGNQNYFSIEYIGNDVSIQPLGVTTTNVFVYTEFQTYGLILKVGPASKYDDLIYVKWKPAYVSMGRPAKKGVKLVAESPLKEIAEIPGTARLRFEKALQTIAGVSVIEFSVENIGQEKLTASDIRVAVSENGRTVSSSAPLFRKGDSVAPNAREEMRFLARIASTEELHFTVTIREKSATTVRTEPKKGLLRSRKR